MTAVTLRAGRSGNVTAPRGWAPPAFGRARYKIVTNRQQLGAYPDGRMRLRDSVDIGLTHTARRNVAVKRVVGAFGALTIGEWVLGTTVAIHAYSVGGALLVGLVGFRFMPAALAGLVTAQFADTHRRERVLTAAASIRALTSGLVVASLALKTPFVVPLLLVWFDAAVGSAYRPAQATLLPTLVHTPTEFTAATALASHAKSSGQMFGALAGGLLVAGLPVAIAVSASTALYAASAVATAGIRAAAPPASARIGLAGRLRRMRDGATAIAGDREAKEIVAYACLRSAIRGVWISLGVVAALKLLGLGNAGFGILMAAAGVGALAAIPISALLVGRRRLARWLAVALVMCGAPIAAIGGAAAGIPAIAFMVGWGMGMAISDVAAQAVLNRIVPPASIGAVTGLMESGKLLFEGSACLIAPALVSTLGIRDALVAVGVAVAVVVAGGARAFTRIDARAVGRVDIVHLLAGVALFRRLRVDLLEGVVAALRPLAVAAGQDVVTQGVRDHAGWYLVEQGRLEVLIDGFVVNELARGDGFGELALLRDRPRSATVRTLTDVKLLSLERDAFLTAVGGGDVQVRADLDATAPGTDDHAELLGATPLLQGVGRGALRELAQRAVMHDVDAGTSIVTEGELDDSYYVLLSGRAGVVVGGQRRTELFPGDAFGEIAVLHRVPRSASVIAETNCGLLAVSGDDLRAAAATRSGLVGELVTAPPPDASSQASRG
jgi:CRP-like cAMP-binding protein